MKVRIRSCEIMREAGVKVVVSLQEDFWVERPVWMDTLRTLSQRSLRGRTGCTRLMPSPAPAGEELAMDYLRSVDVSVPGGGVMRLRHLESEASPRDWCLFSYQATMWELSVLMEF